MSDKQSPFQVIILTWKGFKKQFVKYLISCFLVACFFQTAISQNLFNKIYRSDSDSLIGTYYGSIIATDSAYFLSGITVNLTPTVHNIGLITKLGLNGDVIFHRTYGNPNQTNEFWDIGFLKAEDGGLVKVGINGANSICLLKIRPDGNTVFNRSYYAGSKGTSLTSFGGLCKTQDKGWLLSARETRGNHFTLILIKTDSTGVETNRCEYDNLEYNYGPGVILLEPDGGFIINSVRAKGNSLIDSLYKIQTHIFKINALGQIIWHYITPESRKLSCPRMTRTQDGGLILVGKESFWQIYRGAVKYFSKGCLLKINQHRQLVWEKVMGVPGFSHFGKVIEKSDGLYAFGQNLTSDSTSLSSWVVKLSNTGDTIEYERIISNESFPNHSKDTYAIDVSSTHDNGFIFCGYVDVTCNLEDECGYWGWVVKLDSTGCGVPGCQTVGIENQLKSPSPIHVFPNPAQDKITFQWQAHHHVEELLIYDVWGREITHLDIIPSQSTYDLPLFNFAKGVYIYLLKSKNNETVSGKFIKQ